MSESFLFCFFFFFSSRRRHTRSLRDWSSDVCSSDLENGGSIVRSTTPGAPLFVSGHVVDKDGRPIAGAEVDVWHASPVGLYERSEERRVGKECRSRWARDHRKKKEMYGV